MEEIIIQYLVSSKKELESLEQGYHKLSSFYNLEGARSLLIKSGVSLEGKLAKINICPSVSHMKISGVTPKPNTSEGKILSVAPDRLDMQIEKFLYSIFFNFEKTM
ncbi:MAG: hypothetical protein WC438_01735 [Candidatus Pacearchaeota archaeon]